MFSIDFQGNSIYLHELNKNMWEIIKAVLLGVVEGITEFLPISSTGHLILVNQWVAFTEELTVTFDVFIQLGAILAVVVYFRKKITPAGISGFTDKHYLDFWLKIIIAFLPAVFFGLLFADFIEVHLFNVETVSASLFIGGFLLIILDRNNKRGNIETVEHLPYKVALYIGLFQVLAMVPGTSRSAATIIGALLLGCTRKLAAEFSFFLAIPTIFAASAYSLVKSNIEFSVNDLIVLGTGFIASFIVAMWVIKFLMSYIRDHTFAVFGYYRMGLAALIFLWLYL